MAIDVVRQQGTVSDGRVTVFTPSTGQHYNGVNSSTGDLYNGYKDRFVKYGNLLNFNKYNGSWAVRSNWIDSDGVIKDQRVGLGDARTLQPKRARSFTGTEYGTAGNVCDIGTGSLTVSFWVRTYAYSSSKYLVTKKQGLGATTAGYSVYSISGSNMLFLISDGTTRAYVGSSNVTIGEWTHICCVIDRSNDKMRLYINSVLEDDTESDGPVSSIGSLSNSAPFNIIGHSDGSSLTGQAEIFDARIYDKALTAAEIQHVYTFGESGTDPTTDNLLGQWHYDEESGDTAFDSSGNDYHVTWVNSPAVYEDRSIPFSYQNQVGYGYQSNKVNGYDGWVVGTGWTDNGDGSYTATTATAYNGLSTTVSDNVIVSGQDYIISFDYVVSAGSISARVGGASNHSGNLTGSGTYTGTHTADGTQFIIRSNDAGTPLTATVSNISVKKVGQLVPLVSSTEDVYGNTPTYTGVCPWNGQVVESSCLTLNGTDQAVTGVNVAAPTYPFSLACFVETSTVTGALIGLGSSSVANKYFVLRANAGDSVGVVRRDAVNQYVDDYAVSSLIGSGTVHYCVVFVSSTQIKIYRNGSLDVDATITAMALPTLTHLNVGCLRSISPTGYKQGKFAGAVYYNFALTDEQVQVLAAGGLVESAESLLPLADGDTTNNGVTSVVDRVSRTAYPITNFATSCWANTQDVYHSNAVNGFSWANNLIKYSEDQSNAVWSANTLNASIDPNAYEAPDGNNTATKITMSGQYAGVRQSNIRDNAGEQCTAGVWIKRLSGNTNLHLKLNTTATWYLQPITITDEWAFYTATFTHDGTNQFDFLIQDRNASGWGEILFWRPQFIVGSSLGSDDKYFPTEDVVFDNARIPPSASNPSVDALAGLPLTNPALPGNNDSESKLDFAVVVDALPTTGDIPGDGTLSAVEFGGDYGDINVGVQTSILEGRFTLER